MEPFFSADRKLTVPSGAFSGTTDAIPLTVGDVLEAYVQRVMENQEVLLNIKGKLLTVHLPKEAQVGDTLSLRVASSGANITLELLSPKDSAKPIPPVPPEIAFSGDAVASHLRKLGAPDTPEWRQAAQSLLKYQQPLDMRHLQVVMQSAEGLPEQAGAAAFLLSKELPPTPALVRATADLLSAGATLARDLSQAHLQSMQSTSPVLRELSGLLQEIAQDADTPAGLEKLLKDFGGGKITEALARIEKGVAEKLASAPALVKLDQVMEGLAGRLREVSLFQRNADFSQTGKSDPLPLLTKILADPKVSALTPETPEGVVSALNFIANNKLAIRNLPPDQLARLPKLLNTLTQTLVDKAVAGQVPSALWNDLPDDTLKQVLQKLSTPATMTPPPANAETTSALALRLQQIQQTRAEANNPNEFMSKLLNPPAEPAALKTSPAAGEMRVTPTTPEIAPKPPEMPGAYARRAVESLFAQNNSVLLSKLGAEDLARLLQTVTQSSQGDLSKLFPLLTGAAQRDQLTQELIKLLAATLPQLSGERLPAQLLNTLTTPTLETLIKQLPENSSPGTSAAKEMLANAVAARQPAPVTESTPGMLPFSAEILRQELLSRLDRSRVESLYQAAQKMERAALDQQSDLGSWRSIHQSLQSAADKVAAYKAMTLASPEVIVTEIPLRLGQGEGSALLKVTYRREGKQLDLSRQPVQIALVLDMSALGGVLGDFKILPNAVNGSVKLENEDALRFLKEHAKELEDGLHEAGFQASIAFLKDVIPPRASLLDDRSEPPSPDDLHRLDVKI